MTDRQPEDRPAGDDADFVEIESTTYAAWTEKDVRRGADEARVLEDLADPEGAAARRAAGRPVPDVHANLRDIDGDGTVDEIVVDTADVSGVDSEGRPFGAHDPHAAHRAPGHPGAGGAMPGGIYVTFPGRGSSTAGPGAQGPGLSGMFGAGTPLGEATGLRLAPRKRWVAFLYGLILGFLGAQSFYTGRVFRGVLQAAPVISSWLLALITLGLLAPLAQVVTIAVWIWGAAEGIAYLTARTGAYSVDVLGGRLT